MNCFFSNWGLHTSHAIHFAELLACLWGLFISFVTPRKTYMVSFLRNTRSDKYTVKSWELKQWLPNFSLCTDVSSLHHYFLGEEITVINTESWALIWSFTFHRSDGAWGSAKNFQEVVRCMWFGLIHEKTTKAEVKMEILHLVTN